MFRRLLPIAAFCCALAPLAGAGQVADTFAKVKDSVVVVRIVERVPSPVKFGVSDEVRGNGSGVYIGSRRILTASHVVQVADDVQIEFADGQVLSAQVIASAPAADVALLELPEEPRSVRSLESGAKVQLVILREGNTQQIEGVIP